MNQTYCRCGTAESWTVSVALKYEIQTLAVLLSPWPWAQPRSSFVYNSSLENYYSTEQICAIYSTCIFKSPPMTFRSLNNQRGHLQHPTPGVFVLPSEKLLSPGPVICFDCQGSELAQGGVTMLQAKTSLPLSCGPEGCWDGKPKPCGEMSVWRRTMFKNEPLWAVYAVLKQHYSHLAGGKTNKTYILKLKTHHYCTLLFLWLVAVSCITHYTNDVSFCFQCVCNLTE